MITVLGAVVYQGVEYTDQEILQLAGQRAIYGVDWVYGGDQGFIEGNIYVCRGPGTGNSFSGRHGLRNALEHTKEVLFA